MAAPWIKRAGIGLFALAVLYPLSGLVAPVGGWRWDAEVSAQTVASIRVSLGLTAAAMLIVVLAGTPAALYIARAGVRERLLWQGALLLSIVPVGLGIAWALFDDDHLCWHDRLSRTYLRKC